MSAIAVNFKNGNRSVFSIKAISFTPGLGIVIHLLETDAFLLVKLNGAIETTDGLGEVVKIGECEVRGFTFRRLNQNDVCDILDTIIEGEEDNPEKVVKIVSRQKSKVVTVGELYDKLKILIDEKKLDRTTKVKSIEVTQDKALKINSVEKISDKTIKIIFDEKTEFISIDELYDRLKNSML
jgi:hypothetical protein